MVKYDSIVTGSVCFSKQKYSENLDIVSVGAQGDAQPWVETTGNRFTLKGPVCIVWYQPTGVDEFKPTVLLLANISCWLTVRIEIAREASLMSDD